MAAVHIDNTELLNGYLGDFEPVPDQALGKVVVHLDVNQTIWFDDPAAGKDPNTIILNALAKSVQDVWTDEGDCKPFVDHIYDDRVPGEWFDQSLKPARLEILKECEELFAKPYGALARKVQATALERLTGAVAPAFYNLVDYLERNAESYHIHLRTFGKDLDRAVPEIEERTPIRFERVVASDDPTAMHELFSSKHCAVQDDWKRWNSNGEVPEFGKIFPYEAGTATHFFDDNAKRDFRGRHGCVNAVPLSGEEEGHVFSVDPLQVLFDEHYFTRNIVC